MNEYLRGRAMLLALDNCEHVLAPAAPLVAEIVQQCPVVAGTHDQPVGAGVDGEQL